MSSIKGKSAFLTLLCISCMFSTPSQAGLLGSSIHLTYCYPDNCTVFQDYGTQLAGNGIEFPGVISGGQTLNLTDTQFIFTFISNVYGPALFNGVRASDDTNSLADISSVTIDALTNVNGFGPSSLFFNSNNIFVNWQGLSVSRTSTIVLNVSTQTSHVPEPATIALFGIALAGVTLNRRKKRRTAH